jgi:hypothetical protein
MTTAIAATNIQDPWRRHALEPRHDRHGRRCGAGGCGIATTVNRFAYGISAWW